MLGFNIKPYRHEESIALQAFRGEGFSCGQIDNGKIETNIPLSSKRGNILILQNRWEKTHRICCVWKQPAVHTPVYIHTYKYSIFALLNKKQNLWGQLKWYLCCRFPISFPFANILQSVSIICHLWGWLSLVVIFSLSVVFILKRGSLLRIWPLSELIILSVIFKK